MRNLISRDIQWLAQSHTARWWQYQNSNLGMSDSKVSAISLYNSGSQIVAFMRITWKACWKTSGSHPQWVRICTFTKFPPEADAADQRATPWEFLDRLLPTRQLWRARGSQTRCNPQVVLPPLAIQGWQDANLLEEAPSSPGPHPTHLSLATDHQTRSPSLLPNLSKAPLWHEQSPFNHCQLPRISLDTYWLPQMYRVCIENSTIIIPPLLPSSKELQEFDSCYPINSDSIFFFNVKVFISSKVKKKLFPFLRWEWGQREAKWLGWYH